MRVKKHLLSLLISLLFTHQNLWADVLHWPHLCAGGELQFKNNSTDEQQVWLQKFGKNLIRETELSIEPRGKLTITLDRLNSDERYSILNLNPTINIDIQYKCNGKLYDANSLEGGILTFKKSDLIDNKLWLQNLYNGNNRIDLEILDSNKNKISTAAINLAPQSTIHYLITNKVKNWSYFKISGSHKYSAFNLSNRGAEFPVQINPQNAHADSKSFYFLVEPQDRNTDSFIVKISDEKMAVLARDLIANPQKEKMLFAKIQKDHQGYNRNWSKTEKNFWSWSTTEVTNFAEIGSTACNGTAQQLEDRVDYWVEDPGQICFWNYRVKKELSLKEVEQGL